MKGKCEESDRDCAEREREREAGVVFFLSKAVSGASCVQRETRAQQGNLAEARGERLKGRGKTTPNNHSEDRESKLGGEGPGTGDK